MQTKQFWLMKSEPDEASIDDLAQKKILPWTGVRNYQARNFMRDSMQIDDGVLFYHSSCPQPGIAGLATVASSPYPDATQFDPQSPYFDAKANKENPRWINIDVQFVAKIKLINLVTLRQHAKLSSMRVLQRGSRLSITPVSLEEWDYLNSVLIKVDS